MTTYGKFIGVDFASDPTNVDLNRSPMAVNLVSDTSGFPEKRVGWRCLSFLPNHPMPVNGIHRIIINGVEHMLVHCGQNLYRKDGNAWEDLGEINFWTGLQLEHYERGMRSVSVVADGKLWILSGTDYYYYDGETVGLAADIAHIPLVSINTSPATGLGTSFEHVNLLSPSRQKSYEGDGTVTSFHVHNEVIPDINTIKAWVGGEETTDFVIHSWGMSGTAIEFNSAPPAPLVPGQDNVLIQYDFPVEGYGLVRQCTVMGLFGMGGESDRIFFAGNPERPNADWHCEISYPEYRVDPAYIPDTSFALVGSDENAIMGYRRYGAYQLIFKSDNEQDATVFLRTAELDDNGEFRYAVKQGAAGVGAVSKYAFANLNDDPLFFSDKGVFGVYSSSVANITAIQNRSFFVDKKLTLEPNKSEMFALQWRDYYLLFANNTGSHNVYVLDGRQFMKQHQRSGSKAIYECMLWSNIPARCAVVVDDDLYFGTADGRFCRFNTDLPAPDCFFDMLEPSDDTIMPIQALWSTKVDDDGDFARLKSTLKRGCAIMIKPGMKSSVRVYVSTQKNAELFVGVFEPERFDFNDIDFSDFSFQAGDVVEILPMDKSIKKYATLQFIAVNNELEEGFAVAGITKRFILNTFVK